jgi:hypothetical protein
VRPPDTGGHEGGPGGGPRSLGEPLPALEGWGHIQKYWPSIGEHSLPHQTHQLHLSIFTSPAPAGFFHSRFPNSQQLPASARTQLSSSSPGARKQPLHLRVLMGPHGDGGIVYDDVLIKVAELGLIRSLSICTSSCVNFKASGTLAYAKAQPWIRHVDPFYRRKQTNMQTYTISTKQGRADGSGASLGTCSCRTGCGF